MSVESDLRRNGDDPIQGQAEAVKRVLQELLDEKHADLGKQVAHPLFPENPVITRVLNRVKLYW